LLSRPAGDAGSNNRTRPTEHEMFNEIKQAILFTVVTMVLLGGV
jgi:hypothetical protein